MWERPTTRRGANRIRNVRELAAAGNPWARDLIAAGYPEREVTTSSETIVHSRTGRPQAIA
jgi:hypothetical protein